MKRKSLKLLFVMSIFFAFLQANSYADNSLTSHWAFENYQIAKEDNWLIEETSGGFAPDLPSPREKAVAMLIMAWETAVRNGKADNSLKQPQPTALNNFTDTSKISPDLKDEIAAAVANGIIKGDANKINPKNNITRAEFAVILSRITKSNATAGKSVFKDKLPDWAKDGILKAYAAGLIKGYSDNTFKPQATITNAEALTMIKRWVYGEDIYSVLSSVQIANLKSYPEIKGEFYLSNTTYRKTYKEEFHQLAKAAKDYMTILGTYSYKDLQDTQKSEALKNFYLKYCNFSPENKQIIDTYVNDIIKNKRIKSTRFLLNSSTIYRCGTFNGACVRGIEEFKMIEGSPEDAGTKTGKTYQRYVELHLQKTVNGVALFDLINLSEPVLVK